MASPQESISMAVFCDFENVALGVRDAKFDRFDMKPVLERLLLKGSIVVKKAYCDWDRYKTFKADMHEASFELIEIPHVRQSGKNSADIRLVVDALDLCYTKSHVDTFVIVSGDSDFSPLVSKLRENAKKVIGVGVKNSTSDLLVANCDEFIFYDDLVREQQREAARREKSEKSATAKRSTNDERAAKPDPEDRKAKAIALAVDTFDALASERGDSGKIWASVLKSAIKRRRPDFNESRYGFRAFGNLLEEAQARGLLEIGRDEKSGTFVQRPGGSDASGNGDAVHDVDDTHRDVEASDVQKSAQRRRQRPRSDTHAIHAIHAATGTVASNEAVAPTEAVEPQRTEIAPAEPAREEQADTQSAKREAATHDELNDAAKSTRRGKRPSRKSAKKSDDAPEVDTSPRAKEAAPASASEQIGNNGETAPVKKARKSTARSRRSRTNSGDAST
ncbi:NYN domain-containing protein [Paraburkholderia kururiensis]|uniref:NYN domain-containing protein n=1 Tax=Paraburkholderia kururiensis TaxID=984307 RepID=UPI001470844E|nr:NYN domain-containing protein [Paraburkholderia kururiensis]